MKKLVLIMVFVLLMALFIAFNYLLWDRESKISELKTLEYTNINNSSRISEQSRDIKRLENEITSFETEVARLEKEKEQLSQQITQLESERNAEKLNTKHRIEIINFLKSNADIKLFEAPVKSWADAINSGDYEEAYRLEFENATLQNQPPSLEEYIDELKNNVKSIKIKETVLDDTGKADGEMNLAVTLEVKLADEPRQDFTRFTEGTNTIKVKLDHDDIMDQLVIVEISS